MNYREAHSVKDKVPAGHRLHVLPPTRFGRPAVYSLLSRCGATGGGSQGPPEHRYLNRTLAAISYNFLTSESLVGMGQEPLTLGVRQWN